jgi:hypothetical protein
VSRPRYYDRQGKPMTLEEWAPTVDDAKLKRVAETTLPDGKWISTVWLGLDHNFNERGPPLIFETMVFSSSREMTELYTERYSTEAEALAGHEAMVAKWSAKLEARADE